MTKRPKMTKISIFIIDISIYLDLPKEEQTDRCTDCQLKEKQARATLVFI